MITYNVFMILYPRNHDNYNVCMILYPRIHDNYNVFMILYPRIHDLQNERYIDYLKEKWWTNNPNRAVTRAAPR